MRRISLAMCWLLLCPLAVHAADQTVLGKQLLVKNPSTPDKQKVIVKAAEDASPNTLVGDPTVSGATLSIAVYGGTASSQLYTLLAGNSPMTGKPFWKGTAAKGFSYKDAKGENGPVKVLKLKKTPAGTLQIKAVVSGKGGTVTVRPPDEGLNGCALLSVGGGDSYSVRFTDGEVKNKGATLFKVKDPLTEGSCVPSCGNGLVESGEQCDAPGSSCGGTAVCQADCTCPCDFLDQNDCLFPFPSDYLTKVDLTTDTGRRVHYAVDTMPRNVGMTPITPGDYNLNDGFSQGTTMMVRVPNVDLVQTDAPPITDIERSLDGDSPVVLINATTLAQHPIWAELDANATSEPSRALIIRPGVNLDEGQRYIVALRNMKDGGGAAIAPGADFLAYRDATPTGDKVKEARRGQMESIFTTLTAAGIARNDLYLAWDFTVASQRSVTERLLFMRDDAFTRLGANAPVFTVSLVEDEIDSRIFRRVTGTFEVERYVNSTAPGARFTLDVNGLPIHQATPQVAPFVCNIPRAAMLNAAAAAVPARASIYGHGLLGSHTEVGSGNVRDMSNEHNFVFCATDWMGMANGDVLNAVSILQNFSNFPSLTDRLQQAMINQLFLARLMIHPAGFTADAAFKDTFNTPVIDTGAVFYDGNSQGGIYGGVVMAIAQDITRGVLGVPGMNYSNLLTRSIDFTGYAAIMNPAYPNEMQRPLVLALAQMLWDRSEPNGYARHITNDPLPNTPVHHVLLHEAFGDHQVANVTTEIEARTMGASIHQPTIVPLRHSDLNPYWGIAAIPSYPFFGSAMIVWDSGAATPPVENLPPTMGSDPHGAPRNSLIGRNQKSDFLQVGGFVTDVCSAAPCVP